MRAWRIAKANRATDLTGQGAAIEGGRWNEAEVPAVYMGLSPAICCLESFVHQTGRTQGYKKTVRTSKARAGNTLSKQIKSKKMLRADSRPAGAARKKSRGLRARAAAWAAPLHPQDQAG